MANGKSQTERGLIVVTQARISVHRIDGEQRFSGPLPAPRRAKIPALRAGSLTLWSHRHVGVRGTPGSVPGPATDAVGGHKAVNSGWPIVQNKANLNRTVAALTAVLAGSYEEYTRMIGPRKQSQFAPACSGPVRAFRGTGILRVPPDRGRNAHPAKKRLTASLQTRLARKTKPICGRPEATLTPAGKGVMTQRGRSWLGKNKANPRVSSLKFEVSRRRSPAAIPPTSNFTLHTSNSPRPKQSQSLRPDCLPRCSADGYNPGAEFFGFGALIWGAGVHIFTNAEFSAPVQKGNLMRRVALGNPGKQGLTDENRVSGTVG